MYAINITELLQNPDYCPSDFSASVAEIGQNAGNDTWCAATEWVRDTPLLADSEGLNSVRRWMCSSGAWDDQQIAAMADMSLQALALQILSGYIREHLLAEFGAVPAVSPVDWGGICEGDIYRAGDGQLFFNIGD